MLSSNAFTPHVTRARGARRRDLERRHRAGARAPGRQAAVTTGEPIGGFSTTGLGTNISQPIEEHAQ